MMTIEFEPGQIEALKAKLDPAHVSQRAQAGRKLSYVEGWHVIAEANRIFGFGDWHRETVEMKCVAEAERKIGQNGTAGWGVSYIAKVRVTVGPIIREGYGAGHGIDRDLGLAHESAMKEAETDAMKRAFVTFGNPFGLALYDKSGENVGCDEPEKPAPREIVRQQLRESVDQERAGEPPYAERVQRMIAAVGQKADHEALNALVESSNFVNAYNDLPATARRQIDAAVMARRKALGEPASQPELVT